MSEQLNYGGKWRQYRGVPDHNLIPDMQIQSYSAAVLVILGCIIVWYSGPECLLIWITGCHIVLAPGLLVPHNF